MNVRIVKNNYGVHVATIMTTPYAQVEDRKAVEFFTDPSECLQVGRFLRPKGYSTRSHAHAPEERKVQATAEVLFVLKGRVHLWTDRVLTFLTAGDVAIILRGYHSILVEEDAEIWEVKNGPYQADEKKFNIKEIG